MLGRNSCGFNMFVASVVQYRFQDLMENIKPCKSTEISRSCVILIYLCTDLYFVSNLLYLLLVFHQMNQLKKNKFFSCSDHHNFFKGKLKLIHSNQGRNGHVQYLILNHFIFHISFQTNCFSAFNYFCKNMLQLNI